MFTDPISQALTRRSVHLYVQYRPVIVMWWTNPVVTVVQNTIIISNHYAPSIVVVREATFPTFHCRSGQLDRPDHQNSPTKFDRPRFEALHDLFLTKYARVWSSNDRVLVELIGYWSAKTLLPRSHWIFTRSYLIISTSTRTVPDHFPIACVLDCYSTFLSVRNNRVGNRIDADHPDHLPDRFPILIGLDQVDMIGIGNLASRALLVCISFILIVKSVQYIQSTVVLMICFFFLSLR